MSAAAEGPKTGENRVALVTGGTRGIGFAIVEALLERGWRVFFCGREAGKVAAAEAKLHERFAVGSDRVSGRVCDVRRQAEVDALVAWTLECSSGRLDCLVNNAGLATFAAVDELSGDEWREMLETNLHGAFYTLRAAAPALRVGGGWVFNIASLAGRNAFAGGAAYNASKFGLIGLSEAAMLDLRHDGVRVTAILPGSVDTEFGHPDGAAPAADRDRGWRLQPEDVARVVIDLLDFPDRALPSLVEIRPSRPPKK